MSDDIIIDGSAGEGGGQILRTALTLSLVTGRPFRAVRIRAGRPRPGLLRQHLTAVQAAGEVGGARMDGAALGSSELRFVPGGIRGGDYRFAIGTAGSTSLVLQTLLPALLHAPTASRVVIEGGTHNPASPPFEFIAESYVPQLVRMGAVVRVSLERHGFYPAGGGQVTAAIEPCAALKPLEWLERGEAQITARALAASLPKKIARFELDIVRERLRLSAEACRVDAVETSVSPGNVVQIFVRSSGGCEVVTSFGERGVTAETVAGRACDEAERLMAAAVPVGPHLADQLLVPLALAGGGMFRTLTPTRHARTNGDVIARFLDVRIHSVEEHDGTHRVEVMSGTGAASVRGTREASDEHA